MQKKVDVQLKIVLFQWIRFLIDSVTCGLKTVCIKVLIHPWNYESNILLIHQIRQLAFCFSVSWTNMIYQKTRLPHP